MKLGNLIQNRKISVAFSVLASIAVVTLSAAATTTISTNIVTGGSVTVGTTLDVTGASTLATLSVSGASALTGAVGIASTSPYVKLGVTGTTTSSAGMVIGATGSAITQILFGTCSVNLPSITASTTAVADCTATGVTTTDKVFVTPSGLEDDVIFTSASSTGANTIQVAAYNVGSLIGDGSINPAAATWSWMAIK